LPKAKKGAKKLMLQGFSGKFPYFEKKRRRRSKKAKKTPNCPYFEEIKIGNFCGSSEIYRGIARES
jgi:hypothetical protein